MRTKKATRRRTRTKWVAAGAFAASAIVARPIGIHAAGVRPARAIAPERMAIGRLQETWPEFRAEQSSTPRLRDHAAPAAPALAGSRVEQSSTVANSHTITGSAF